MVYSAYVMEEDYTGLVRDFLDVIICKGKPSVQRSVHVIHGVGFDLLENVEKVADVAVFMGEESMGSCLTGVDYKPGEVEYFDVLPIPSVYKGITFEVDSEEEAVGVVRDAVEEAFRKRRSREWTTFLRNMLEAENEEF